MRKLRMLFAAAALLGACSRTENGDVVVKRPADIEITTTQDTLHMPKIRSKVDTVSTPVVGTQKETLVVNKPVVGTKKSVVKIPTVQKP